MCYLISNLIYSVFRTGNNYYPQVFLEECNYFVKEEKISKYIIDNIEISSDCYRGDSDEENSNEKNSNEKILMKKNLMKKILMK